MEDGYLETNQGEWDKQEKTQEEKPFKIKQGIKNKQTIKNRNSDGNKCWIIN